MEEFLAGFGHHWAGLIFVSSMTVIIAVYYITLHE